MKKNNTDTVQKMNYDGASDESSDISDGDLNGFSDSDDESASQTNMMENIVAPAVPDDQDKMSQYLLQIEIVIWEVSVMLLHQSHYQPT